MTKMKPIPSHYENYCSPKCHLQTSSLFDPSLKFKVLVSKRVTKKTAEH